MKIVISSEMSVTTALDRSLNLKEFGAQRPGKRRELVNQEENKIQSRYMCLPSES